MIFAPLLDRADAVVQDVDSGPERALAVDVLGDPWVVAVLWLRTNGVNTNGAAAKVIILTDWGEKVHPGTSGKYK